MSSWPPTRDASAPTRDAWPATCCSSEPTRLAWPPTRDAWPAPRGAWPRFQFAFGPITTKSNACRQVASPSNRGGQRGRIRDIFASLSSVAPPCAVIGGVALPQPPPASGGGEGGGQTRRCRRGGSADGDEGAAVAFQAGAGAREGANAVALCRPWRAAGGVLPGVALLADTARG